jgi:radical SAM/Cys-rich protein
VNTFELRVRNYCSLDMHNSELRIMQVNVGLQCNLSCTHCHLKCGPGRSETMKLEAMMQVIEVVADLRPEMVDITGGAPELNPHLRSFIRCLREEGLNVQCRTNLTVLLESGQEDLPEFFRENGVGLVASLPCYLEENVCAQRGQGTYSSSLTALRKLNALGSSHPHQHAHRAFLESTREK